MRVLLMDDYADTVETLAPLLKLAGHEVWAVHTGHEALGLAAECQFHVAILDIAMPGLGGPEVARRLRRECPGVFVMALSGVPPKTVPPQDLELFDCYWLKPVVISELVAYLSASGNVLPPVSAPA
jgi:two-component system, OmpR family, response regulator